MYKTKYYSLILKLFTDNSNEVFMANEVIDKFKAYMNKATIYRILSRLESDNIISKSYNELLECYEYRLISKCQNHIHLICKTCGKVVHLECEYSNSFLKHIFNEHSFIIDRKSSIYGICKECDTNA